MDEQVGEALKTLDDLGMANDTIVLFFADHGWQRMFLKKKAHLCVCHRMPPRSSCQPPRRRISVLQSGRATSGAR